MNFLPVKMRARIPSQSKKSKNSEMYKSASHPNERRIFFVNVSTTYKDCIGILANLT